MPFISTGAVLGYLFFLLALLALPALASADRCKVVRIVDGDTIVVDYHGRREKVRLLCVNTPESVHRDRKQNIPMGKLAAQYTKQRLSGKYVDLVFEGRRRGRYGRLLAYVFVDGENFNVELVRQGLSPYYTKYGLSQTYDRQFRAAERYARQHRLNIWGDPHLTRKYLRLKSKWGQYSSRSTLGSTSQSITPREAAYIGNARSHKVHRPDCPWAKKIAPTHRVLFKSRQEAIDRGYVPCRFCRP